MSDAGLRLRPSRSELEARLEHRFARGELLERALTHSSYANDRGDTDHNERLEFLGDAVIGLVVAHLLTESHSDWNEGELTRGLSALVHKGSLARLAKRLGLGDFLLLGRTERSSDGHEKDTILADAVEAVIGAMYLDGGLPPVQALARRVFADAFEDGAAPIPPDPKTALQERLMGQGQELPIYAVVGDTEVDGDDARFTVEVIVAGKVVGASTARSKRRAERGAAAAALERLGAEDPAAEDTRAPAEGAADD